MSRHHGSIANEIHHTVHAVQSMSKDEVTRIYGIEIKDDGSIHDPTYSMNFNNVSEWATFCVEQDHTDQYEHIHHIDDDYY